MDLPRPSAGRTGYPGFALIRALTIALIALLLCIAVAGVSAAVAVLAYPDSALGRRLQAVPYRLRAALRPAQQHSGFVPAPALAATPAQSDEPTENVAPPATPAPAAEPVTAAPPAAEPAPAPQVTLPLLPPRLQLPPPRHEYQTWNNCGPATLSMALRLLGRNQSQAIIARVLKPDPDDKNVSPAELAAYARAERFDAGVYVNGDIDRLKYLLAINAAVIVETWFEPRPNDGMGHYRLVLGYDDQTAQLIFHDSYNGPLTRIGYAEFDTLWRVFNRTYIVLTRPEQREHLLAVLGPDADEATMYARALARAQAEAAARPTDAFAWFNIGSSMVGLGNFADAAVAFDRARQIGLPWRMLWYQFGPFQAYEAVGRWQDILNLTAYNLRTAANLEESHYFRGRALQALGRPAEARQAFQAALRYNPHFAPAAEALAALG
jgi:tetratricopeptide (TPR) repeat protein